MFIASSRNFFDMVCALIEARGFSAPRWSSWLDIRGMALAGQTVEAVKMLRVDCARTVQYEFPADTSVSKETQEFVRNYRDISKTELLSLRIAVDVIRLLQHDELIVD